MTHKYDFSILAKAGIPQGEFAVMCGVSRVTVHLWCKGNHPNRFLRDKVLQTLESIQAAVESKRLPLPGHVRFGPGHIEAVRKALNPAT